MSKKVQELNIVTEANNSDLLYIVRDTGGVYTDHKIARDNLIGEIPRDSFTWTDEWDFSSNDELNDFTIDGVMDYSATVEGGTTFLDLNCDYQGPDNWVEVAKYDFEQINPRNGVVLETRVRGNADIFLWSEPVAGVHSGISIYLSQDQLTCNTGSATMSSRDYANYHIYRFEYIEGENVKMYVDGVFELECEYTEQNLSNRAMGYYVASGDHAYVDYLYVNTKRIENVIPSDISALTDTTGVIPEPAKDRQTFSFNFSNLTADNIYQKPVETNSTIAVGTSGLTFTMGTSTNDRALFRIQLPLIPNIYNRNPKFTVLLNNYNMNSVTLNIGFALNNFNYDAKQLGWETNGSMVLKSVSGDGADFTKTTLDTTFGNQVTRELTIKLNSGVNAQYYVDGVLKTTHTTRLPTGTQGSYTFLFDVTRTAGTGSNPLYLSQFIMEYDTVITT